MTRKLNILLKGLLCMSAAWLFYSCSDNSETTERPMRELHVVLGSQQYEDVTPSTRTTLPDGYEEYIYATALSPITQIQGYMTSASAAQRDEAYVPCLFSLSASEDVTPVYTWSSRVALDDGTYYFYGFMPREDVTSSVSIAPYQGDYALGAVLTFTDLDVMTAKDINIIVGVQGYQSSLPSDMSSRVGKFDYDPSTEGDKLYLLTEHLYAGLEFQMKVNPVYDELRTICLKSITLQSDKADSGEDPLKTVTATVTVQANATSPTVEFSSFKRGTDGKVATIYDGEKNLTTEYQSFLACMCPGSNLNYVLETTYDVYDKKGNLVREDQTARNAIKLDHTIGAGTKRLVRIEVNPTYLYVLSDPDLDNPTFRVTVN